MGIKRDASAYPIFKNERYYNTFIRHFKATAKAQELTSLMDPNFTPGSDERTQPKLRILDHSTTSRLIPKTMMSGVPQQLKKKYTFKHLLSLDLLPHHDPMYPQRHLNPTSPLPTSRRGLRGMQVPIPSSRMKGTTTPSFVTSRQLQRHKD